MQPVAVKERGTEPGHRPDSRKDLNEPAVIQADGVLFMEGEGQPEELLSMVVFDRASAVRRKVDPGLTVAGSAGPLLPVHPLHARSPKVAVHRRADGGEEAVRPDLGVQPVAAEPVLHESLHLGEGKHHLLVLQLTEQLQEGISGGGVHIGDGLSRHHHPADGGCGRGDQVADAAPEVVGVGEEQRGVEPVQQQPGDLAGVGMTFGTIGGMILADGILQRKNQIAGCKLEF